MAVLTSVCLTLPQNHPIAASYFLNPLHSLEKNFIFWSDRCLSLGICFYLKRMTKVKKCVSIYLQLVIPQRELNRVFWFWRRQLGPGARKSRHVIGEANGCLSSFAWPSVIKPPLRHFKRPAYASSSYAPSVPKKTEEHPARYKMLDQRTKMKKIQNISQNWNRK